MGVTVAKRLERLVRIVPGVAGYQDRDNARATDKQVRMRLVDELRRLIRGLEEDKERLAARGDLSALPRLDRLAGRLERQSREVEFAGRGYTGLFDALSAVRAKAEAVRAALADAEALRVAADHMREALDDFGDLFDQRRRIVDAG
jgi:hypothetical protein